MPANEEIVDTISTTNLKTIGEIAAHSMGLAMQNAVTAQQIATANMLSHQQAMNTLQATVVGMLAKTLTEVDTLESVANVKALTGDDVAQKISNLLAALAHGQQAAKVGQTTPPPTP